MNAVSNNGMVILGTTCSRGSVLMSWREHGASIASRPDELMQHAQTRQTQVDSLDSIFCCAAGARAV